jgi:hypothetical protein
VHSKAFLIHIFSQILDLRERGAETTVSHSEGTGMSEFTTKRGGANVGNRGKPGRARLRGPASTLTSNVMLSTVGSIHPDVEAAEVELDAMHFELGIGYAGESTRSLGSGSVAPAYNSVELGFNALSAGSATDESGAACLSGVAGIRVDIEKTTSTM